MPHTARAARDRRRVVVTGYGLVTPLGIEAGTIWNALREGHSGVSAIDEFDTSRLRSRVAGICRDFDARQHFDSRELSRLDRVTQLALVAATSALADAGLSAGTPATSGMAVVMGTGFGGQAAFDAAYMAYFDMIDRSPMFIPKAMYNASASHIAMRHGLRGANITVTTACSSGANAIGQGLQMVRHGYADRVLAGGADAPVTAPLMRTWSDMRVLSTHNDPPARACKPFSENRNGFVLAEGAGFVVLEDLDAAVERSARIHAEVLGYGSTADAHHITLPSADGESEAMLKALGDADLEPGEIDYINAHGTATPANDRSETEAIKRVFGARAYSLPLSSTKSMMGHCMGAAGAIELIATIMAVSHREAPPTINYEEADPSCDLDYLTTGARPLQAARESLRALSNSFGFGGNNAVLAVGEYTSR